MSQGNPASVSFFLFFYFWHYISNSRLVKEEELTSLGELLLQESSHGSASPVTRRQIVPPVIFGNDSLAAQYN